MKPDFKNRMLATVATDTVLFAIREQQLVLALIKMPSQTRDTEPIFEDCWALPGGIILLNETADTAATRNLRRLTSVTADFQEQLYTFSQIDRDPRGRVLSIAYYAAVQEPDAHKLQCLEDRTRVVRWWPVKLLPKLAYDHEKIVDVAVDRLRSKITYSDMAKFFVPPTFTMRQLQTAFEVITDETLDKRNFSKRIKSFGFTEPTGERTIGGAHRPAALHRFKDTRRLDVWKSVDGPKAEGLRAVAKNVTKASR